MQMQKKEPAKLASNIDFGSYLLAPDKQRKEELAPKGDDIIKAVGAFNSAFEDNARKEYEKSVVRELKRLVGKKSKKKQKKKGKRK